MKKKTTTQEMKKEVIKMLNDRGVTIESIAEVVLAIQKKYVPDLTLDSACYHLESILNKREVLHAMLVGITLDVMAEEKKLPYPLQELVETDEPLFGVDEIIPLSIVLCYGPISLTNFGALDKEKIGIIKKLDTHGDKVHTFLDDLVCALASAAASRIAHKVGDLQDDI